MKEMKVREESMEESIIEWANYKLEIENKEKWTSFSMNQQ